MAEQRRRDMRTEVQETTGAAVRRRGLIAGAAALVAGMVAKQTGQPVAAGGSQGTALILGDSTNTATATTAITVNASVADGLKVTTPNNTVGGNAISSYATGTAAVGLYGNATGPGTYGVLAVASGTNTTGVSGDGMTGIEGIANSGGASGIGVVGRGYMGTGMLGESYSGTAVQGQIPTSVGPGANTAANTIAVTGINQSSGAGGIGVYGIIPGGNQANTIAISGSNNATAANSHGIVGVATVGHGLVGTTNYTPPAAGGPPYYAGLVGNAPNGAYAGLFFGPVSITGTLNGHTAIMQHSQVAVAHPDGTHRLANGVSAVDAWLEDVGKGTLTNGQAAVKIDPAFAALADLGDYHVFLTAHGDYHLHVAEMKPDGFMVRATSVGAVTQPTGGGLVAGSQVAKAGGGTGTFSWRVMAKRKDGLAARLATYVVPNITAPDLSHLPKAAPADLPKKPNTPERAAGGVRWRGRGRAPSAHGGAG